MRPNSLLFFSKKICFVNPYRVQCLKTSRILTRLFRFSERRQGLSSFGQDVFVMTFPTPLLTSHVLPQDFVGLTTNCAVNGIWYSILQQSPIGIRGLSAKPKRHLWSGCIVEEEVWTSLTSLCSKVLHQQATRLSFHDYPFDLCQTWLLFPRFFSLTLAEAFQIALKLPVAKHRDCISCG